MLRSRRPHLAAVAVVGSLLLPAVAGAIFVEVQFHGGIDLSRFHTYEWEKGEPAAHFGVEKAMHEEIDLQLAEKGLRKVDEGADCWVMTNVVQDRSFPGGALRVEVFEAATGKLAWSGLATGRVTARNPNKRAKYAVRAVRKMFKQYPALEP